MKTLCVLTSVMVVLFLAAPNKIEAQKRKAAKVIEGTITGYECGDNCYLTITDRNGKEHIGLCTAPVCSKWNRDAMMPDSYKGRRVKVIVGKGTRLTYAGDVVDTMDAFTRIQFTESEPIRAEEEGDTAVIDKFISKQESRESGYEYKDARKVIAGDLNRDGVPDLAVLYTLEGQQGSNYWARILAVFIRAKGTLVPITHTAVGGKGGRGVELQSIRNNVIFLKTFNYGPNDPACCPSKEGTTRFVLVNRRLKER